MNTCGRFRRAPESEEFPAETPAVTFSSGKMTILDELCAGVTTASAEETRAFGARLAAVFPVDATLALHGDLGVGKTTFVQGLARGFGISAHVTSPTFNILHLYRNAGRPQRPGGHGANPEGADGGTSALHSAVSPGPTLVHLDAYRLENACQIDALMLDDFLVSPYCLVVEWPERIADWLPAETWHLTLAIAEPGRHRLTLGQPG
jgi:tRNA threonylcarbamoyladenosine biosynthesis protein TsaE